MKAQVALNISGLGPRQISDKVHTAIAKITENVAIFGTPSEPTLLQATTNVTALDDKLDEIARKEQELQQLRIQRDQLVATCVGDYTRLGDFVQAKAGGNPAIISAGGYDVAGSRSGIPLMTKPENCVVTSGDDEGTADAACDRVKGAKAYEWQISANGTSGWTHYKTTTPSRLSLKLLTSGQRLWVRVRAINKKGEGPWSDPATCMVP